MQVWWRKPHWFRRQKSEKFFKDDNIEFQVILKIRSMSQTHTKVGKGAKIRNRYNQVPQLTQDTKGKVTNSQLDTTNES